MDERAPLIGSSHGTANYAGAAGPYPPQGATPQVGGAYPQSGGASSADTEEHDPEASAPPAESMDLVPGYGNIGFEGAALPPPIYEQAAREPQPSRPDVKSVPAISEQDARDAIIQHVSEHCCYGKGPALDMAFTDLVSSSAFHYCLETFAEGRSTKWTSQPYNGEGLIVTGPPPGPWDIQVQPPQLFKTSSMDIEVPNTASVKPCYNCGARGYKTCFQCLGTGRKTCITCHGTGRERYYRDGEHHHRHCTFCHGGFRTCFTCNGSGQRMCQKCKGRGNLRWFILLTIKWTNHVEDHIVERTSLPSELIRNVRGQTAFEESNTRVWPVNHFPEQEINAASNSLVSKHGSQFTSERIIMQRHNVRIVPVTQVFYTYKSQSSTFYVYGDEHKVHAPDYPAKCCCGCTVL